ncbi:MAG: PhzF family phenazine biosynthesis protein [Acidimicrobiia bacterium]|nr:PhzF family phenazine biosynthesis protein [Acidimicrobiia bacterium]
MSRSCLILRVFTRDQLGGNHLGVVTDLSGLDTATMQRIAADLGFSETIFIEDGAVPYIRIFTPAMELPFAGHPLVGAAAVMLGARPELNRLRCGIGEVSIGADNRDFWVGVAVDASKATPDTTGFAMQVGLPEPLSTWRVAMPLDYRLVELKSASDVSGVSPDLDAFGEAFGLTAYARTGDSIRMRFFTPEAGVPEDPATGSAAVALATMYVARGEAAGAVQIDQGEEIGHPSRINLRWQAATASIGGSVARDGMRELEL